MKRKKIYQFKASEPITEEGYLEAVFSVFDVVDSDGDVVKSSAIEDGIEIPLVWAHDWQKPIGKGIIVNDGKKAIFKGNFFLNSTWGRDAYETVKAMDSLQQYSWGFQVLEESKGELNGKVVNDITKTEAFEVSPVLIGANRETETLLVKQQAQQKYYGDSKVTGSYEDLADELNKAFAKQQFEGDAYEGYTYVIATFDDHFVAMLWKWTDDEESYWEVPYKRGDNGLELGTPTQVESQTTFVPVVPSGKGLAFDKHSDIVRVVVSEWVRRCNSGSEIRRKEGRSISAARREIMSSIVVSLQDAAKNIQTMLDETAPSTEGAEAEDASKIYAEFLRTESALLGV